MESKTNRRKARLDEWSKLIREALLRNASFKDFKSEVLDKYRKAPLDGVGIVAAWVMAHDGGFTVRSRQIRYFEQLLQLELYSHEDAIRAMLPMVKPTMLAADEYFIKRGAAKGEYRQCVEAVMLQRLAYNLLNMRSLETDKHDRAIDYRIYKPLCSLVSLYIDTVSTVDVLQGPVLSIGLELGKFLGVFINDLSVTGVLISDDGGPPRLMKKEFGRLLTTFIPIISSGSTDVGQSLAMLQQQSGLYQEQDIERGEDGVAESIKSMTFQQSVVDLPLVVTRAALYVFLNAMLTARPIADDTALFGFLNARYNGNVNNLIADLITASFDVLANAISRSEATSSVCRCFLVNKVPVLLQSYSHLLFPPNTTETCITGALRSVDPSGDPYSQQGFDLLSSSGMLSEARQEFLFSCALYGLLPESSIETILGDVPMQSLPEAGKYNRTDLVAQCTTNPSRIDELVNELENFEGQAAEISAALTQIVRDCCAGSDSVTLKGICNALTRRTQALDVLLLFEQPSTILQPLCQLLDQWQDSEDHSESHPVYDEFGSIFLLVLVFKQRFDLPLADLGVTYADSFVYRYFTTGCVPRPHGELTEAQRKQLGGWVKGLFEAEGISDDLMSSCSPKDFHLLVATLFEQSLYATQAGYLPFDTLKGGFEYLLEPFLIPSLVTGLGWAARRLWQTQSSAPHLDALLPLLSQLIRPASLSPEAKALHECVLSASAAPLQRALAHVQRVHPRRSDVAPLIAVLSARTTPPRSAVVSRHDLEAWSTGSPGGLTHTLRNAVHGLVAWSARCASTAAQAPSAAGGGSGAPAAAGGVSSAMQAPPPPYLHRHPLAAVRMLGAPVVLQALVDEARKLTAGHTPPGTAGHSTAHSSAAAGPSFDPELVLDVVAAIICAPDASTVDAPTLRTTLNAAIDDLFPVTRADPARAELLVRLHRRIQLQCLRPQAHDGEVGGGVDLGEHGGDADLSGAAAGMGADDLLMDLGGDAGAGTVGDAADLGVAGFEAASADLVAKGADMDLDDLDLQNAGDGLVDSDFAW